jgi:hypothetical protein
MTGFDHFIPLALGSRVPPRAGRRWQSVDLAQEARTGVRDPGRRCGGWLRRWAAGNPMRTSVRLSAISRIESKPDPRGDPRRREDGRGSRRRAGRHRADARRSEGDDRHLVGRPDHGPSAGGCHVDPGDGRRSRRRERTGANGGEPDRRGRRHLDGRPDAERSHHPDGNGAAEGGEEPPRRLRRRGGRGQVSRLPPQQAEKARDTST